MLQVRCIKITVQIEEVEINLHIFFRLACSPNTVDVSTEQLRKIGSNVAAALKENVGINVSGGVYSSIENKESGKLWFYEDRWQDLEFELSGLENFTVRDLGTQKDEHREINLIESIKDIVMKGVRDLQQLCCPKDPRFRLVETNDRGKSVIACEEVEAGAVVGVYHGYLRGLFQESNKNYRASILGDTDCIDPTFNGEDVCLEFSNNVCPRVNEPPPGFQTNVGWCPRGGQAPLYVTTRKVEPEEELFIFYGKVYEERDYPIASGLEFTVVGIGEQSHKAIVC